MTPCPIVTMGGGPVSETRSNPGVGGDLPRLHSPPIVPGVHVTKLIGKGGQGVVYEAIRERPQQVVAVKVPLVGAGGAPGAGALRREADLLASLAHANIVKVFEVTPGEVDGVAVPCVVLELVEGSRTIIQYATEMCLTQRQRVELMIKVAGALQHMHERLRSLHRDLKPGNILVGRDGEPKVIDVGMAVSGDQTDRLRERGQIVGTIDYMAPEQFDGDTAYLTQRTDVYALGVILFELLSGRLPYDLAGRTEAEKEQVIRAAAPMDLAAACRLEFSALAEVVAVALRKENGPHSSEHRWDTPGIFAEQLQLALAAVDPASRAGPAADRLSADPELLASPSSKANRRAVAVILALVTVAIAVAIAWLCGESAAKNTGISNSFERWVFRTPPPAVQDRSINSFAVVGFRSTDEAAEVAKVLKAKGLPVDGVDPAKVKTWRPIYPAFLELIDAEAGAAAVTFDIVFGAPSESDALWAKSLERVRIPVIVCVDTGKLDQSTANSLNPQILKPPMRWGGNSLDADASHAWSADLLLQRQSQPPRPAISTQTLASVRFPKPAAEHHFTTDDRAHTLTIESMVPNPAVPSIKMSDGPPSSAWTTSVATLGDLSPEDQQAFGFRDGDRLTGLMLAVPPQAQLDSVTHSMLDVFTATPDTLRKWFKDRAVFVANLTPLAADHFIHPDGRDIAGVYGHALAYDAMLTGRGIRRANDWLVLAGAVGAAAIPALLICTHPKRRAAFLFLIALLTAAILALAFVLSYWLLRHHLWYVPAYAPAAAVLLSAVLACTIKLTCWDRWLGISKAPS